MSHGFIYLVFPNAEKPIKVQHKVLSRKIQLENYVSLLNHMTNVC